MKIIYTDPIFPVIFYHDSLGWVKINLRLDNILVSKNIQVSSYTLLSYFSRIGTIPPPNILSFTEY